MIELDKDWFIGFDNTLHWPNIMHKQCNTNLGFRNVCNSCKVPIPVELVKKFNFIYPDYQYD